MLMARTKTRFVHERRKTATENEDEVVHERRKMATTKIQLKTTVQQKTATDLLKHKQYEQLNEVIKNNAIKYL